MSRSFEIAASDHPLDLSVVIVAHNMARELPRTLRSFATGYQTGLERDRYEVIVVDNGSDEPVREAAFRHLDLDLRVLTMESPRPSPVMAINRGLQAARGELIGAHIDGARIASPGILASALRASRLWERPVVATCGFHLGPDVQTRSVPAGYDRASEDRLLESIHWPESGYRLFDVSVFALSSSGGWFAPMSESNCLFLTREMWTELGGFEERFTTPGGGYCNLDLFRRACVLPRSQLVVLLGEGTFHQIHGGIATNRQNTPHEDFRREYEAIRSEPFRPPVVPTQFLGGAPAARTLECSVATLTAPILSSAGPIDPIPGRSWATAAPRWLLDDIQVGVLKTRYGGVPFFKSPFDIALYLQLIGRLKPRTVIEIGAKFGGSALWFADQLGCQGNGARIVAVDVAPLVTFSDPRIDFIVGDARALQECLPAPYLDELPRPWLIVEDSAHLEETSSAVLEFFHGKMKPGEYLVVEDGVLAFFSEQKYREYEEGPNRAVAGFLRRHPKVFEIDTSLCDQFGFNVTYNTNAWLRKR